MTFSLFGRVTRYAANPSLDPHENRLTEISAAVLERHEGFAWAFARHLVAEASEQAESSTPRAVTDEERARRARVLERVEALRGGRVIVATQKTTRTGRLVDLEFHLRPPLGRVAPDVLLWVEVKHGAGLHGNQLHVYVKDVAFEAAEYGTVVVLAPRGNMPRVEDLPPEVAAVEWQAVGNVADEWTTRSAAPEQRWLLSEYIAYLKENGLMDPEGLTPVHALALLERDRAEAAMVPICEVADEWVQKNWGERYDYHKSTKDVPLYGLDYWATYDAHRRGEESSPTWLGGIFDWGLRKASGLSYFDAPRGAYLFIAGVALATKKENAATADGNEEWVAERRAAGFEYFWHVWYRLARVRYPDSLLSETTVRLRNSYANLGQARVPPLCWRYSVRGMDEPSSELPRAGVGRTRPRSRHAPARCSAAKVGEHREGLLYADTSTLVKLVVREAESDALEKELGPWLGCL